MLTKNFTQFDLKTSLLSSDFLIGYNADGSAEYRTTADRVVDLVKNSAGLLPLTSFQEASGNWQSTYTTVETNSANWNSVYTNVQSNSAYWESIVIDSIGSKTIYVDNSRTDSFVPDGSEAKPYSTFRQAFSAIGNAANTTEFDALSSRYWTIKAKAGFYNESAGGDLQVPKRFFVKLDFTDGVSLSGNLVRDISGLVAGLGDNPVFLIEGSSNRPSYEIAGTVQRTQIGVLGNISMVNTNGSINALHLFAAGVRKVEYSGTGGIGHFFANQNSTWDTLFSPTKQVTFYCAGTRNSESVASAGNVIGNIYINPVYDTYWISNKSVFSTNQVYFRFDEDVAPPTYIERRATSFTRSSNQATVTLAENHGLSLSPAIVSDGYVPEQYIIINGVSEDTSFNTPLYGAKVISYPTPNTVVYESSGVDVTTPVVALSSKFIRGTFLGNASLVGFNQMGANGRASENAAMTFPNFANAAELGQGSAFLLGFAKGVSFSNPLTSWPASTTLPKNTILILDDQFQYRTTTGVGRTSTIQPVFPTTIGATVQDGFVTWVCEENALNRNETPSFNVQSKLEKLSNAGNIYLKSSVPTLSSFRNVQNAIEFVNTNTNSVFTTVQANSASWEESADITAVTTTVASNSANWNTAYNVATTYQSNSAITTGKTIYVDATRGTDTRTELSKYDIGRPFATIAAAVDASVTGDLVYIRAGTYTIISQINLNNNGNIFFETGAVVQVFPAVVAFSFSQTALPINAISIRGNADFQLLGTTAGVLTMPSGNATTTVQFECNSISGPNSVTGTLFNCAVGVLSVDVQLIQMTTTFTASNTTVFNITGSGRVTSRVPFVYCGVFLNGQGGITGTPAQFNTDTWTLFTYDNIAGMTIRNMSTNFRIVNYSHVGGVKFNWTEDTASEGHIFNGVRWISLAGLPSMSFASSVGTADKKYFSLSNSNVFKGSLTNSLSASVPVGVFVQSSYATVSASDNVTFKVGSFTVDPLVGNIYI